VGCAAVVVIALVPSWDGQHRNDDEQDACRNHPRAANEPANPSECSAGDEEGKGAASDHEQPGSSGHEQATATWLVVAV